MPAGHMVVARVIVPPYFGTPSESHQFAWIGIEEEEVDGGAGETVLVVSSGSGCVEDDVDGNSADGVVPVAVETGVDVDVEHADNTDETTSKITIKPNRIFFII